jgi:hypothetical protein
MQKNDQNPPAKNPSCHVKVQLVCGDGPLYIITFSKKNGILGNADFPPNKHTPTRRHADTPTRRPRTRGTHTANTHTANTHTPRGGWKVETDEPKGGFVNQGALQQNSPSNCSRDKGADIASHTVRWRFDARSTHTWHWHGTAGFSDGCCGFHSGPSPCELKHRFSDRSS